MSDNDMQERSNLFWHLVNLGWLLFAFSPILWGYLIDGIAWMEGCRVNLSHRSSCAGNTTRTSVGLNNLKTLSYLIIFTLPIGLTGFVITAFLNLAAAIRTKRNKRILEDLKNRD